MTFSFDNMTAAHRASLLEQMSDLARQRRAESYALAQAIDDGGWDKAPNKIWSRMLCGAKLNYYPTKDKWLYKTQDFEGKSHVDVYRFIYSHETAERVRAFKQAENQWVFDRICKMRQRLDAEVRP